MIDNFALGLTHALMLYVAWRLLASGRLDREDVPDAVAPKRGWGRR